MDDHAANETPGWSRQAPVSASSIGNERLLGSRCGGEEGGVYEVEV